MVFSLQKISDADFPFLMEVYRSTRERELAIINWSEIQKDNFIEFQFNAQHSYYLHTFPGIDLFIVKRKTDKVGRLYIWRNAEEIRIVDIIILPGFRNRGIGSAILKQLAEEADQKNKILTMHVEKQNPAVDLYVRFGFERIKEEGTHFYMERKPANL